MVTLIWDVTPCSLLKFPEVEDEGFEIFRNVGDFIPDISYPRRQLSAWSPS
jgi:hypothetical protein